MVNQLERPLSIPIMDYLVCKSIKFEAVYRNGWPK